MSVFGVFPSVRGEKIINTGVHVMVFTSPLFINDSFVCHVENHSKVMERYSQFMDHHGLKLIERHQRSIVLKQTLSNLKIRELKIVVACLKIETIYQFAPNFVLYNYHVMNPIQRVNFKNLSESVPNFVVCCFPIFAGKMCEQILFHWNAPD